MNGISNIILKQMSSASCTRIMHERRFKLSSDKINFTDIKREVPCKLFVVEFRFCKVSDKIKKKKNRERDTSQSSINWSAENVM